MKAITYTTTSTENIAGISNRTHVNNPIGYAYETDTHFVHFYGKNVRWWTISNGITVTEQKTGSLENWVRKTFGAQHIKPMLSEPGVVNKCVWRPGLFFQDDTFKAFNFTAKEMRLSSQSIKLLIERLDELFVYIEPNQSSFGTYSHKTRELLILASTEVENFWNVYMSLSSVPKQNGRTYTTNDYVKLAQHLHLKEYKFALQAYEGIAPIIPFSNWDSLSPTKSLDWYDSYNKTKHDRNSNFSEATLLNCIKAVVANLVMFSVMYSPHALYDQSNTFSSLVNQHFELELINMDPTKFYLPLIDTQGHVPTLLAFDSHSRYKPFVANVVGI
ncbi:hypothetical protein [Mucilaginibacter paludis]|uniref:Hypothetical membrane-associated protein n=1 Tax=Mucilaginibacter paludis DSM 18603 TaxID=714943 RepID=H1Y4N9_9SPHI|nr:hypothetical protein [Mucilaginibacter paludis]EHQ28083.1 hypothetical membrane-associated protein [Mucilaginibacter paludis DSM 18603]